MIDVNLLSFRSVEGACLDRRSPEKEGKLPNKTGNMFHRSTSATLHKTRCKKVESLQVCLDRDIFDRCTDLRQSLATTGMERCHLIPHFLCGSETLRTQEEKGAKETYTLNPKLNMFLCAAEQNRAMGHEAAARDGHCICRDAHRVSRIAAPRIPLVVRSAKSAKLH